MTTTDFELGVYRLLARLRARLKDARDTEQVLRSAMREAAEFLEAEAACLAALAPGDDRASVSFALGADRDWDPDLLTSFFRGERPRIPREVLLGSVLGRAVGVGCHELTPCLTPNHAYACGSTKSWVDVNSTERVTQPRPI